MSKQDIVMERPPNYGEQNAEALQTAFNAGIEKVAPSVAELHEGNRLLMDSAKSLIDDNLAKGRRIIELERLVAATKKDLKKTRRAMSKAGERAAKARAELQEQVVEARVSALAGSRARSRQEMWVDAWVRTAGAANCKEMKVATDWANRMLRDFDAKFGAPAAKLEEGE